MQWSVFARRASQLRLPGPAFTPVNHPCAITGVLKRAEIARFALLISLALYAAHDVMSVSLSRTACAASAGSASATCAGAESGLRRHWGILERDWKTIDQAKLDILLFLRRYNATL